MKTGNTLSAKRHRSLLFAVFAVCCVSAGHADVASGKKFSPNRAYYQGGANEERGMQTGADIPRGTHAKKMVERNRIEYSTVDNAPLYKEAQVRRYERRRILNEVFDPAILMTPVKRVIRPIDTIGISPTYITQIVFPDNMTISDAVSSFNCATFGFNKNLLRVRPTSRDFYSGNIVLTLTDGTKNYAMTIFVDRYYQKDCKIDNGEYICKKARPVSESDEGYKYSYNNLSTFYVYGNPKRIDDMEAFLIYERLTQKTLDIKNDGDMVTFKYDGIFYDIIRDDRKGKISYRGKTYRVVPRG